MTMRYQYGTNKCMNLPIEQVYFVGNQNRIWKRVFAGPVLNLGSYFASARSVTVDNQNVIHVSGICRGLTEVPGDDSFVATLNADGALTESRVVLARKEGAPDPSCSSYFDDNHIQMIACYADKKSVIGSTCRIGQPPFSSGITFCQMCSQEKGQKIGARWQCLAEASHSEERVFSEISYSQHGSVFGSEVIDKLNRLSVKASSSLADVRLTLTSIPDPCRIVRLKNVHIEKEPIDTDCPGGSDPLNSYLNGTTHGKATIGPNPCWP